MNRKRILKCTKYAPFGANLAQLKAKSDTPDVHEEKILVVRKNVS